MNGYEFWGGIKKRNKWMNKAFLLSDSRYTIIKLARENELLDHPRLCEASWFWSIIFIEDEPRHWFLQKGRGKLQLSRSDSSFGSQLQCRGPGRGTLGAILTYSLMLLMNIQNPFRYFKKTKTQSFMKVR